MEIFDNIKIDELRLPVWVWWILIVSLFLAALERFVPWLGRSRRLLAMTLIPFWKLRGHWPLKMTLWYLSLSPAEDQHWISTFEIALHPHGKIRHIGRIWVEYGEHQTRKFPASTRDVTERGGVFTPGFLLDRTRTIELQFHETVSKDGNDSPHVAAAKRRFEEQGPNAELPAQLVIEVDDDRQRFLSDVITISPLGVFVGMHTHASSLPFRRPSILRRWLITIKHAGWKARN